MRYAVVNEASQEVINVIMWDGESPWKPPTGHFLKKSDEVGIGDVWDEKRQEFLRPMSRQKPPENPDTIAAREAEYAQSKELLKSSILFVQPSNGTLEA